MRQSELDSVCEALEDGVQTIHISGQPGVGKTTFLGELSDELSKTYEVRTLHVREGNSPTTLTQELLQEVREAVGAIRALFNSATGGSIGVLGVSGGVSVDDRATHLRKLGSLSRSVPSRKELILLIDDVHKLGEPEVTRDFLREVEGNLGEHVHLISAGRLTFDDAEYTVRLETFSREESAIFLRRKFDDVSSEDTDRLYEQLEGHPYYLGLLTEAADPDTTFRLPKDDARDFIERAYLDSLSEEEEVFIRNTSGLAELDAEICSAVLDGVDRTQARRILDSLSTKAVVTELGRSEDTGDRVFKVHDLFQEFLHRQLEDPDELHRAAFQYYANKLYDAVEESDAPPLEGFVFALMANVHLEAIYDDPPEVAQLRSEFDKLEFEPYERLQFVMGYAPYASTPGEDFGDILAFEFDDYCTWLRELEPENDEEELQIEMYSLMMDLLRSHQRSTSTTEFDETSQEIYDETLQRIQRIDFPAFFDPEDEEAAQIIPDMLLVVAHAAAQRDAEDGVKKAEHLAALFEILEEYGLTRVAIDGFIENCQELVDEYEAGEQAKEMIETQMEQFFNQFDEDDVTRNTLIQMQSDLFVELIDLANSAFTAMISESNRLLEFIHDCGDSLEKADNPFFVAVWYKVAARTYRMFAPEADSTKELEESYQYYAEQRKEYEKELENPLYQIDEFDLREVDFPDLVNTIADSDEARQITD